MEREGNAAAGAGHWEASPNGVIVLPAGSAAPRQPKPKPQQEHHQYQQRQREMERDQERGRERERERKQHRGAAGGLGLDRTQPPEKVYYKTRLCDKFESGKCAYEDGCTFAHGVKELRPPLAVPTSLIQRKSPLRPPQSTVAADGSNGGHYVRLCFEFRDTGSCHRGDHCAFAHASAADMPYPGGPRSLDFALRHAKAFSPGDAAAANHGSSSYAPAAARAFPCVPAEATGEDGRKLTRLELLSRKKMSGIYGDWPEQD